MDYHSSAKQYVSARTRRRSPKVVERRVKVKSQFKQVNKRLQPYIFKKWQVCLLSVEKSLFPGRQKKCLETKILLSKAARSSSEWLDQSCLKPGISIQKESIQTASFWGKWSTAQLTYKSRETSQHKIKFFRFGLRHSMKEKSYFVGSCSEKSCDVE